MIGQKLQPRFGLAPGLRREQLLGVGAVAEGRLFETEESFHHDRYSWSFPSLFCLSSSTKLMPVDSGAGAAAGLTEGN